VLVVHANQIGRFRRQARALGTTSLIMPPLRPGRSAARRSCKPMLVHPQFDPVALQLGPVSIRWYGLMYLVGFVAGLLLGRVRVRSRPDLGWTTRDLDDLLFYCVLGVVLGGRLGYVFFYNFAEYMHEPVRILYVWEGGMSFHGGFLGVVLAVYLFSRFKRISFLSLSDITCAVTPIGLFLGRIANFVNGELWGRASDVPWAMVFPAGGPLPRHPSQLYEAILEGLVLFVLLALLVRGGALKRPGAVTGAFMVFYGLARLVCELFREPDAQLGFFWGGLTMGMLLSLPLMLAGLAFLAISRKTETVQPT